MSFLSGLAAFGGGFAEEAQAVQTAKANQALKQEAMQLREAQLALLMEKTSAAQQKSLQLGTTAPMTADLESAAGLPPSDPTSDPSTALPFASPAATGGLPAGQTGAAGLPPFAAPQAPGGAPARRGAPSGQPPVTQVAPAGQPAGAAGAGMPAPSPQAGQPAAQLGGMPQGQPQPPGAQPQMPPGPNGAPSFDQRFQGQPQPQSIQARPVQTQRIPGQQPSLGGGPPQAPLPDQTFRPQQPKGKRLFDLATPEQQAQAGITQPQQQQGTQVAQAGDDPSVWKPGQPATPANGMSMLRQKYPGRTEADYAIAYKNALPQMRAILNDKLREEQREAIRKHQKVEEGLQVEAAERKKQEAQAKKEKEEHHRQDVQYYVKGIKDRLLPPSIIGTRGDKVEIGAELAKEGVNLQEMQNQWLAAQLDIKAMNAPRARQTFAYARSVQQTLKRTLDAAKKLDLGGFSDYNRAKLEAEGRTLGNTETGKLIRTYITDINTLKAEFSQLENAGYAPTESVWKLANEQINQNWGLGALSASLGEISELIDIRVNAFKHPLSEIQQDNPYIPRQQQEQRQQQQPQQQQKPAAPQPGEYRRFKDGKTRIFKGGDENDPNNWEDAL